jgi:simple sugar transport system ATP-binding protein
MAFADAVSVLRRGRLSGEGRVADLSPARMAEMMIGSREIPAAQQQKSSAAEVAKEPQLAIRNLVVENDSGVAAVEDFTLAVRAGEIVGIAGVSGNGQRELVEALIGQRDPVAGTVLVGGEPFGASRSEIRRHRVFSLPEEPLRNACVASMTVAENMALRNFDLAPIARGLWLNQAAIRDQALRLIAKFKVKTQGVNASIATLSGGNVQRAVLARELSADVSLLIVANPVFGLDFAAVADIHDRILAARNADTAVLLISEDLDELLELSDRIVVMCDGRIVHDTPIAGADVQVIGRHMAGHATEQPQPA